MDGGAWWATVHRVAESDKTERLMCTHACAQVRAHAHTHTHTHTQGLQEIFRIRTLPLVVYSFNLLDTLLRGFLKKGRITITFLEFLHILDASDFQTFVTFNKAQNLRVIFFSLKTLLILLHCLLELNYAGREIICDQTNVFFLFIFQIMKV